MLINGTESNISTQPEPAFFGRIFRSYSGPHRRKLNNDGSLRFRKSDISLMCPSLDEDKSHESSPEIEESIVSSGIGSEKDLVISQKDEVMRKQAAELQNLRKQMSLAQDTLNHSHSSTRNAAQQVNNLQKQLAESKMKTEELEESLQQVLEEKKDLERRCDLLISSPEDETLSIADGSRINGRETLKLQLSERDACIQHLTTQLHESRLLRTSVQEALNSDDSEKRLLHLLEQKDRELREKDFQLSRVKRALQISQQKDSCTESNNLEREEAKMISFMQTKLIEISRALVFSRDLLNKERKSKAALQSNLTEKVEQLEAHLNRNQSAYIDIEERLSTALDQVRGLEMRKTELEQELSRQRSHVKATQIHLEENGENPLRNCDLEDDSELDVFVGHVVVLESPLMDSCAVMNALTETGARLTKEIKLENLVEL